MKTRSRLAKGISLVILPFFLGACIVNETPAPVQSPTRSYATPFEDKAIVGQTAPTVAVENDWPAFTSAQIGVTLQYPPDWQTAELGDPPGVGLYSPGSEPGTSVPVILIAYVQQSYSPGTPLVATGSSLSAASVAGIAGQQYQDTEFTLPNQNLYVEVPYRSGMLFMEAVMGPVKDFSPQFWEILKTIQLLDAQP